MQDILTTYLCQHKYCPLPTIGSLEMIQHPATVLAGDKKINAPYSSIAFSGKEMPAANLIQYLSAELKISLEEAGTRLKDYCKKIKFLGTYEEVELPEAGKFTISSGAGLKFTPLEIPSSYHPVVDAERVIRQQDTHAILVGDTETTNVVMTEFYNEAEVAGRSRWWIWAIVLFAVAMILLFIYFNDTGSNKIFGNAQSIAPNPAGKTYTTGN